MGIDLTTLYSNPKKTIFNIKIYLIILVKIIIIRYLYLKQLFILSNFKVLNRVGTASSVSVLQSAYYYGHSKRNGGR